MEMTLKLGIEIFYIEVWHFLALIVIVALNVWFYRNGEKNGLLFRYLALQCALLLWVVSKMLKTIAPDIDLRWVFIVTQYLGVCFIGPFFILFAWRYVINRDAPLAVRIVLYSWGLITFIVVAANPLHFLFYATYTFYRDTFGPLYYIFSIGTYIQILVGIALFFTGLRAGYSGFLGDLLIALAAILPLAVNVAYSYRLFGFKPMFDYTPLFMTLSLAAFGIAAFRSRFLGMMPAAWKQLLLDLEDPIILTDAHGRVLQVTKLKPETTPLESIEQDGKTYKLHRKISNRTGAVHHYVDVSRITALHDELKEKNDQLSASLKRLKDRKRATMARLRSNMMDQYWRKLHDIVGHSLTQIIYLLRLENKQYKQGSLITEKRLLLKTILAESLNTLEERPAKLAAESNSLSIAIGKLIRSCHYTDLHIELIIRGREQALPVELVRELCDCCREGITNAVKHGSPDTIVISLLFGKTSIALVLSDNGAGCDVVQVGNGLSFMRNSLSRYGGTAEGYGEAQKGFQLTLRIPIP